MISTFAQHTQSPYMYSISKLNIQFILPGDWNAGRLGCWEILNVIMTQQAENAYMGHILLPERLQICDPIYRIAFLGHFLLPERLQICDPICRIAFLGHFLLPNQLQICDPIYRIAFLGHFLILDWLQICDPMSRIAFLGHFLLPDCLYKYKL